MVNRFTATARAALTSAVAEAGRRGDARVGTEHLLLGLLQVDPPVARALGLDLEAARASVQQLDLAALASVGLDVGPQSDLLLTAARRPVRGHRPFTAAARAALARTVREARHRGDRRLTPVHLALALLDCEPPDAVCALLDRAGVDRSAVLERLADAA